jgi:hypothetical protein
VRYKAHLSKLLNVRDMQIDKELGRVGGFYVGGIGGRSCGHLQKVPKFESPPLHTIRRSACPDSIFRTQGNAITSPHFHVFDLFSCSTCLTCLLVSFSPAVQSMYLNHLPLVSQIISINPNVGELSFAVLCSFSLCSPSSPLPRRFHAAKCLKRSKSHPSNALRANASCSILLSSQMPIGTRGAISQR